MSSQIHIEGVPSPLQTIGEFTSNFTLTTPVGVGVAVQVHMINPQATTDVVMEIRGVS